MTSIVVEAQERNRAVIRGGGDLVSAYVWRGVYQTGPSLQPQLSFEAGRFAITAWGSVDFNASYKEMDIICSYMLGPVTLSLADLYWTGHDDDRYFSVGSQSPHRIEAGVSWVISPRIPLTVSWNTILFGAADKNNQGKRAYATYIELSYPFQVGGVDLRSGIGAVPWNAEATYLCGDRDLYVQNIFVRAVKMWSVKGINSMNLGFFTDLSWNPAREDVTFAGGVSYRF